MVKETDYAIFVYDVNDENLVFDLNSYINMHIQKILDFFEINSLVIKPKIKIYSTKKEYDETLEFFKDESVPKWVVGNVEQNLIKYVSYSDFQNTSHANEPYEYYLKTIVHEYVHFITGIYCQEKNVEYPIKYISEGLAYYLSGQGESVKINGNLKIDDILNSNKAFASWYLLANYIIKTKGKKFFIELLCDKKLAESEANNLLLEANCYYNGNY